MKRSIIVALSTLLLTCSSAFAEVAADNAAVASQEWRSLIDPMAPIGERLLAQMPDKEDPQLRQELYRMVFSGMSEAYMGMFLGDPKYPDFWPVYNMAYNFFGPNPDDVYYQVRIDGGGIYKISGFRGSVRMVQFQISGGTFIANGSGNLGPTFAQYDLDKFHINQDGSFEAILSTNRPAGYKGNWWKLDPAAKWILLRQISYDWQHEVDGRIAIERLDLPAIRPRMTAQEIDANLRMISSWAENWSKFSMDWLRNRLVAKDMINKVAVVDWTNTGGFSGEQQKYIEGLFDLEPDEAVIYETELPTHCRYWNIQITNMLWSTIDYMSRQTSLNGYSARLDKDGKFRAVIAATDPGVPNWLDSAGYKRGSLLGRWTGCSSTPTPALTRIKLADVRKYLPADTPVVNAAERDAALRLRRKSAQLRRRW